MRWALVITLAFALPLADAAPVPKHLMKNHLAWPTTIGTKWVYGHNESDIVEEITQVEEIKGGVRLTVTCKGGASTPDILEVTSDGVTRRSSGSHILDQQILRFPIIPDDSWSYAVPVQPSSGSHNGKMAVREAEEVKVPAGTFRAMKVVNTVTETNGKALDEPRVYTYWYANSVGLVRIKSAKGEWVLKSFTPGKK